MQRIPLFARVPPRTGLSPRRPGVHLGLVTALMLVVGGLVTGGTGGGQPEALAAVVHQTGFQATVAGWTSWYGSYGLGALGWGWCIDHGIPAPDAAYGYVPISIDNETDGDAQAAMAWAATMYHPNTAIDAAAVMLALHDLRRAVYPSGTLDVDAIGVGNLGGFGGAEGAVLERARAIKADARAHAHLRAPFSMSFHLVPADPGVETVGWAVVTDANGAPVAGAPATVSSFGPQLTSPATGTTADNGSVGFTFLPTVGINRFAAAADVADPQPRLFGPTTVRAQRIIQPRSYRVESETQFELTPPTTLPPTTQPPTTQPPTTMPPPTTTPTTRPTTTTSRPTTTTTRAPTTTTTTSPPVTPPRRVTTTVPPSSTTTSSTTTSSSTTSSSTTSSSTTSSTSTTTVPPETTFAPPSTAVPRTPTPPAVTTRGSLPTTGGDTGSLALIGLGLVLVGASLLSRTVWAAPRAVPPFGRTSSTARRNDGANGEAHL